MATPASGDSNMLAEDDSSTVPLVNSYPIHVLKDHNKKLSIMKFNASLGIDFTNWTEPKMGRENNEVHQLQSLNKEIPKSGKGSEYGGEAQEEARRKRYGGSKEFKPEDQPWILQYGGEDGKKFRGVREGGVMENASYYILTPGTNDSFDAFPVSEWYNFHPVQRYEALDYEEAEEKFKARNKVYNKFKMMLQKRMKEGEGNDGEDESDDEDGTGKRKGKKKGPKGDLRHGDEKDEMDSSGDSSDEYFDDEKKDKHKKKGKKATARKRRQIFEDNGDSDGEGRLEFDSTSSSDAERDPDEEDSEEEDEDEDMEEDEDGEKDDQCLMFDKKRSSRKNGKKSPKEDYGLSSTSDSDGDSSTSEKKKINPSPKPKSRANSKCATPKKFAGASSSDRKRKGGTADCEGKSSSTASNPAVKSSANEEVSVASVRRL